MTRGSVTVQEMVSEARARVKEMSKAELEHDLQSGEALLLDIRDVRERWRDGAIPGARHVPRGMLEFWADPGCIYHKDFMDPERPTVLYCAGGQRSALAALALQQLGYRQVAHLAIGYNDWKAQGGATEEVHPDRS